MLERLLSEMGVDIQELKRQSYDILTDEAKKVAQDLISLLGISQDEIQPSTKNTIVVYNDARLALVDKTEESGQFGERRHGRQGNFKKGNVNIIFKPDKTSGEYFKLKPQDLGITLDKFISLDQLKLELANGIKNNERISEGERDVLLYLVTQENKPTEEEINQVFSNVKFNNELLKNLGEPLGALNYGEELNASSVFFPAAGNYPMIDYILKVGNEEIPISAKSSKGVGNTVKPIDLEKVVKSRGGKIDTEKQEFIDIISNNSVMVGSLKLIEKFGSDKLKDELEEFYETHPEFPKLDYEGHRARIKLEKDLIKELNLNPKFNFSDLFNQYVNVIYVKYKLDVPSLDESSIVIDQGKFEIKILSKNSPGHDSDRLGFQVKQMKVK